MTTNSDKSAKQEDSELEALLVQHETLLRQKQQAEQKFLDSGGTVEELKEALNKNQPG